MPGDSANSHKSFPFTHWSEIGRAASGEQRALNRLLAGYLEALRANLVEKKRVPPDQADDLIQAFVLEKILQGDLLAKARQEKGRFQDFSAHRSAEFHDQFHPQSIGTQTRRGHRRGCLD